MLRTKYNWQLMTIPITIVDNPFISYYKVYSHWFDMHLFQTYIKYLRNLKQNWKNQGIPKFKAPEIRGVMKISEASQKRTKVILRPESVQIWRFFWSVFSCIQSKSPYSIWIKENTYQKKILYFHFSHNVIVRIKGSF